VSTSAPPSQRINQSLPLDVPIARLDDELVEAVLVPAARTQIASSRQQLLATMVMLGSIASSSPTAPSMPRSCSI